MTIEESIRALTDAGAELSVAGDHIRVALPDNLGSAFDAALDVVRDNKADALILLGREAAHQFVNRAGARLVCTSCWPGCQLGARFAVLVPIVNDDERFREALRVLKLDHLQVIPRTEPLGMIRPTPQCRRRNDVWLQPENAESTGFQGTRQ